METVLKAISDWIKSLLTAAIMSNLNGLFDDVNTQVGSIAQQVGTKPSAFEPRVFAMIEALSRNVVLPIAGIILTFIACYELIQMITEHNNMAQFEPALLMKWIFKTAVSVWLISNTFEIIMAVFDVTQQVVANSSGIISGNTRVNEVGLSMLEASMMQMEVGPLFGLFLQSFFIGISMRILSIIIFVLVYGRMIEIYMIDDFADPEFFPGKLKMMEKKRPQNFLLTGMSDLSGWKPEWREEVFVKIRENPQHQFLFLTKRPDSLDFDTDLENAWFGVTVTRKAELWRIDALRKNVRAKHYHVTFEPLFDDPGTVDLSGINWIVVGTMTGAQSRKIHTEPEWAWFLADQAHKLGIPVFMKEDLVPIIGDENMIQEMPEEFNKVLEVQKSWKK